MTATPPTSTDGQPLGARGLRTRKRILDAIADLVGRHGLRGLRLTDVAEQIGFSPPAFYQYFDDMDDAILAMCKEVSEQVPAFDFSPGDRPDESSWADGSRPFVLSFFEYWDAHRSVLRARNISVNEGDERFRNTRDEAFRPMIETLMTAIENSKQQGLVAERVSPRSLASALVLMLDRIGMMSPRLLEPYGEGPEEVVDAVSYIFDRVIGLHPSDDTTT